MVEAAVKGIVDFSQAKFFDPGWRRRIQLLINGLENLNYRRELENDQHYLLSQMSIPGLKDESFAALQKQLAATRDKLQVAYRPWSTVEGQEAAVSREAAKATQAWESKYGKLDDPETQAKIARTAQALRKQRAAAATGNLSDEALTDHRKRAAARAAAGRPARQTRREDAVGRNIHATTW
jgi:hypothetical protein